MTEKWDELDRQERQLSYQLEEVMNNRFRAEQVYVELESYESSAYSSENNLWEAAYGSKYANQLEENSQQIRHNKNHFFEDFDAFIDNLKRQERQIEDKMDAIYYEKRKESLK